MLWERKRENQESENISCLKKCVSMCSPTIQAKVIQVEEEEVSTISTYFVKIKYFAYLASLLSST